MWGINWLAIYTIDNTTGTIRSTNIFADMPQLPRWTAAVTFSPAGQFIAVSETNGLQIFHFNGADPATPDGGLLLANLMAGSTAWDNNNHLYALAATPTPPPAIEQVSLYAFTVTAAGIEQVAGSPWDAPHGYRMLAVPRTSSPPTSGGSTPGESATSPAPRSFRPKEQARTG